MTRSRAELAVLRTPLWFCARTLPKHEPTPSAGLRPQLNLECCSPRLRFRKMTRRGVVWFVEAMFPGYLFAEFIYSELHRRVEHLPGVRGLVEFGDYIATIDADTIVALKEQVGEDENVTVDPDIKVGQSVWIGGGRLRGLAAVVRRVPGAGERLEVLLDSSA